MKLSRSSALLALAAGTLAACASHRATPLELQLLQDEGRLETHLAQPSPSPGATELLFDACSFAVPSAIPVLVEAGADLGARNGDGATPLHAAVASMSEECVRVLLEAGADPSARNDAGRTPAEEVPYAIVEIERMIADSRETRRIQDGYGVAPTAIELMTHGSEMSRVNQQQTVLTIEQEQELEARIGNASAIVDLLAGGGR